MESINILTGQHITIKYEPASVVQRMTALILDYIFMSVYFTALLFIFFKMFDIENYSDNKIAYLFLSLFFLPVLCYHVIFETLMSGQTPGKFILKIRVTNINGSSPNFLSYFLRWILLPIDYMPYGGLGAILIIFTKNHQRLGDMAAGTTVVKIIPSSAKYKADNVFNEFVTNYNPVFSQAEFISEGQIRLISEILEKPSRDNAINLSIEQLTSKIKQKLDIETQMNDLDFLRTIVKDYYYFATLGF